MNQLTRLVWIGLLLGWSSCNRFDDQQPTPDHGPPPGSLQALTQQYPQAQDIQFTTLANNQLWLATFVQQSRRYQALLSPERLLSADQRIDDVLADSLTRLLAPTVVAGGTFDNPRLRHYDWFRSPGNAGKVMPVYADYTWQQQPYTASWTITQLASGQITYYLELLPFQLAAYETDTLTDLPESLRATLREQGLTFTYAWVQVEAVGKRRYTLSVQKQGEYLYLSYDEGGQLIAVSNEPTAQHLQQLDQLPPAIQQYLQRPELADFGLKGTDASLTHHTYGTRSTYRVNLQKDNQAWLMTFSDQGQLISRSFLTHGSF